VCVIIRDLLAYYVRHFKGFDSLSDLSIEYAPPSEPFTIRDEITHYDGNMPLFHLNEVMYEVFFNAIKYSFVGGQVKASLGREEDDVIIRVQDYGIGIAPEDVPKIGKSFFRATNATAHTNIGKGGGYFKYILPLLRDKYHATIVIESPGVGKGTTVTIRIPTERVREPQGSRPRRSELRIASHHLSPESATISPLLELHPPRPIVFSTVPSTDSRVSEATPREATVETVPIRVDGRSTLDSLEGKYAVVVDMEVFENLSNDQRVEFYKSFAQYAANKKVKFIFNMTTDRQLTPVYKELSDFRDQHRDIVEIRVNPTHFRFDGRKVISFSKEGVTGHFIEAVENALRGSQGDYLLARYKQGDMNAGLLTAALLLLEYDDDEVITRGEYFSEVPARFTDMINQFLLSYVYVRRSA